MSNSFAIIETGSKQYRVEPQAILEIEKIRVPENAKEVSLDRVLLIHDGKGLEVGKPVIQGATVLCDYLGNFRTKKVISFKFRRRKASRRIRGHRQELVRLRVKEIRRGK